MPHGATGDGELVWSVMLEASDMEARFRRPLTTQGRSLAGATDIGQVRAANEDAYYVDPMRRFLVVADGVGGMPAGAVASALATAEVSLLLSELPTAHRHGERLGEALTAALQSAQTCVVHEAKHESAWAGMCTTLVAAYRDGSRMATVHVGDVRVYHLRKGQVVAVSEDHSLVAELVRAGEITAEQARSHPKRNIVTQAIGQPEPLEPRLTAFEMKKGDDLLLCSDGLFDVLSDNEIVGIVAADASCRRRALGLIEAANGAGAPDNVTVALYRHPATAKAQRA